MSNNNIIKDDWITIDGGQEFLNNHLNSTLEETLNDLDKLKEEKRKKRLEENNKTKVSFYSMDDYIFIHNIEQHLFISSQYDMNLFLTNNEFTELEKYGFIQLISNYYKKDVFSKNDIYIDIFNCKYNKSFDGEECIITYVDEYGLKYKQLRDEEHKSYILTDKNMSNRYRIDEDTQILGYKVKLIPRQNKSLLWRLTHKRQFIVKDYTNLDY